MCLLTCFCSVAQTLDDVISKLENFDNRQTKVRYEVSLPSVSDPVVYEIELIEQMPGDEYSPAHAYIIDWTLPRGEKTSHGFNAYFDGNHFRYRDTRLQEYHVTEDSIPFTGQGGGVAMTAQFADMLTSSIARKLRSMENDTTFQSNFDPKTLTLSGVQRVQGYDALEYTYVFDSETGLPQTIDMVYNPASISEQIVTATFTLMETSGQPVIDEDYLIGRYGDVFEKYRNSNFRAENLIDTQLPTFTYVDSTSQRKSHVRGENDLSTLSVLVFIDDQVAGNDAIIETLRYAAAQLPLPVGLVYAVKNDNRSLPKDGLRDNESRVSRSSELIRQCGVTSYPTLMIVSRGDGTVRQVHVGRDIDADSLAQEILSEN